MLAPVPVGRGTVAASGTGARPGPGDPEQFAQTAQRANIRAGGLGPAGCSTPRLDGGHHKPPPGTR